MIRRSRVGVAGAVFAVLAAATAAAQQPEALACAVPVHHVQYRN